MRLILRAFINNPFKKVLMGKEKKKKKQLGVVWVKKKMLIHHSLLITL